SASADYLVTDSSATSHGADNPGQSAITVFACLQALQCLLVSQLVPSLLSSWPDATYQRIHSRFSGF
ncbi:MAG: hypothetical protein O2930_11045, partial [Acidobacteria bacterium]|nr:hypothetical protein [Acidobacteriota bacterium]